MKITVSIPQQNMENGEYDRTRNRFQQNCDMSGYVGKNCADTLLTLITHILQHL